jgi:hypothetical protein
MQVVKPHSYAAVLSVELYVYFLSYNGGREEYLFIAKSLWLKIQMTKDKETSVFWGKLKCNIFNSQRNPALM